MKGQQRIHRHVISRRRFLQFCGLGVANLLGAGSCLRQPPEQQMTRVPGEGTSIAFLTSTPTLQPTPSQTPTVTPTPVVEKVLAEDTLSHVIVAHNPQADGYPAAPPFDPSEVYPEYPFSGDETSPANKAYALVRQALGSLSPNGMGDRLWNPLSGIVKPGETVLIKPNLVDDAVWDQGKITHPAVIRAVIDYVYLACGPTGRIIVGEGPWAVGVFDRLVQTTGIQPMVQHLAKEHGVPVVLEDLNKAVPDQTPLIDLQERSAFRGIDRRWYDAHSKRLYADGNPRVSAYRIAPTVLQADVVISVPKIKVHCSGGLTLNMKNMLGIIPAWDGEDDGSLKDCAHTSDLDRAKGGRGEYLENDTIWRSMADLNRILLYADRNGALQAERQRRYLAIVDGVVAGEASQYEPHPRPLGTVVIGFDPVSVDAVTARVVGFDYRRLRSVMNPATQGPYGLGPAEPSRIHLTLSGASALQEFCGSERIIIPELKVYSWQGHVEAGDFQPPALSWRYDGEGQQLIASATDPVGVAYVRLSYRRLGEPRVMDLELSRGDSLNGEWSVLLPAPQQVTEARLSAMDALFNAGQAAVQL